MFKFKMKAVKLYPEAVIFKITIVFFFEIAVACKYS